MRLIWTPPALADRDQIWREIAQDNADAASRLDARFSDAASQLIEFPQSGRPGAISGTRELIPHRNYRLVYSVDRGTVWIVALLHVARAWPPTRIDEQ